MEFDLSVFLAKFFGLYCLIIGVFLVTRKDVLEGLIEEFQEDHSLWFVTGVLNLMLGLAVVLIHNIWELNWVGLVTFFGYIAVLKGMVRLFAPGKSLEMIGNILHGTGYWVMVALTFIFGVYLTYAGFFEF